MFIILVEMSIDKVCCGYRHLGLYSLSGKTSYRNISWSLEAARFGFKLFQSLWNLAGTSAALLPRCLSNYRAIRPLQHPISRLRDFTRFGGKTSYCLVNRGPEGTTIPCERTPLIVRFMGPTWGPSGADRTQVCPMLAPWTLLSGTAPMTWAKPSSKCYSAVWITGSSWNKSVDIFCLKLKTAYKKNR